MGKEVVVLLALIVSLSFVVAAVNVQTFDYSQEKTSVAKPVINSEDDFYVNSLPDEIHPVVFPNIDEMKTRIKSEPYRSWYVDLKNRYSINDDPSKMSRFEKSQYAKAMAFFYAMEGKDYYGGRARDLLLAAGGGDYDKDHFEDIDGLTYFAEAYDTLEGVNYDFEKKQLGACSYECSCKKILFIKYSCKTCYDCEKKIRDELNDQTNQVAETSIVEATLQMGDSLTRKNNQHIRRYSAVGIASIVLNNDNAFKSVMNGGTSFGVLGSVADLGWKVLTGIVSLFSKSAANDMKGMSMHYDGLGEVIDYQIVHNSEGGWAEGPYYLRYSFDVAIPFMKTMENAGAEHEWLKVEKLRNAILEWPIDIAMPDGAMPPFDDSNKDASYSFTGYLDDSEGNWLWDKSYYTNAPPLTYNVDAISYYDSSLGEKVPDRNPSQSLSGAGQIVFRSNWSDDAVYLALLGENGKAVEGGFLHEHPDTMSVVLSAYGQYLAIDSGYCDWENREKVNAPENHNVILADGKLASEGFGVDSDFFSTDYLTYGKVKDRADDERGVLFVDGDYFIIFDTMKSDIERNYQFMLHGNGLEGTSSFEESSQKGGAEWVQNGVGLFAYVINSVGDSVDLKEFYNCNAWQDLQKHTAMVISKRGKGSEFLSLLYPSENRVYPSVSQEDVNGINVLRISKDNWDAFSFVNAAGSLAEVDNMKTDAERFFVKKAAGGDTEYIFADGVTKIYTDERKVFQSENPTTVAIKFTSAGMDINYKDNGNIELYQETNNVVYDGEERNDLYKDGVLEL